MRSYIQLNALMLASLSPFPVLCLNLEQRQAYSQKMVSMTFYGYPDNCDSTGCYGAEVAEDCKNPDGKSRNYKAGGDGTWNNPLSMVGNFKACTTVYLPYLRKYGIIDDTCEGCGSDQMDIWVQSACNDNFEKICECEFGLTPDQKQAVYYNIKSDQGPALPVAKGPLYDGKTQKCLSTVYNSGVGDIAGQSLPRTYTMTLNHRLGRRVCESANECACKAC